MFNCNGHWLVNIIIVLIFCFSSQSEVKPRPCDQLHKAWQPHSPAQPELYNPASMDANTNHL